MAAALDSRLVRRPSGGFSILGPLPHPGADALTPIRDAAYPGLSQAHLGTVGTVLARGAPQVMRLACLSATISMALQSLAAQGLAAFSKEGAGKGRRAERWFAVVKREAS